MPCAYCKSEKEDRYHMKNQVFLCSMCVQMLIGMDSDEIMAELKSANGDEDKQWAVSCFMPTKGAR